MGVFAHEFGHDLGLPDLYDYTGENATGFWTIMSSGSWLSQNDYDIGSQPNHFGVWEKFQLGWLNYEVAFCGREVGAQTGPGREPTPSRPRACSWCCPTRLSPNRLPIRTKANTSTTAVRATTWTTGCTKSFTLAAGSTLDCNGQSSRSKSIGITPTWWFRPTVAQPGTTSRPTYQPIRTPTVRTLATASPATPVVGCL